MLRPAAPPIPQPFRARATARGPTTPQRHPDGRPDSYLHALPPRTPPSSGVRPHTREEANPASSVPQQRTADIVPAPAAGDRGGDGYSPTAARARSRTAHWPPGSRLSLFLPARVRCYCSASSQYFAQNFSARAARRLAGVGSEGRERGGGARASSGAGPRGEGGRDGRVTHTPTNQESSPGKEVGPCTWKKHRFHDAVRGVGKQGSRLVRRVEGGESCLWAGVGVPGGPARYLRALDTQ